MWRYPTSKVQQHTTATEPTPNTHKNVILHHKNITFTYWNVYLDSVFLVHLCKSKSILNRSPLIFCTSWGSLFLVDGLKVVYLPSRWRLRPHSTNSHLWVCWRWWDIHYHWGIYREYIYIIIIIIISPWPRPSPTDLHAAKRGREKQKNKYIWFVFGGPDQQI